MTIRIFLRGIALAMAISPLFLIAFSAKKANKPAKITYCGRVFISDSWPTSSRNQGLSFTVDGQPVFIAGPAVVEEISGD